MPYLSPLLLASTEFHKISQKRRNFAATSKFRDLAQNSVCRGKLWSLMMMNAVLHLMAVMCVLFLEPSLTTWNHLITIHYNHPGKTCEYLSTEVISFIRQ